MRDKRRAELRGRCRRALAEHIRQETGLVVQPTRVRLSPSSGDGYVWSAKPEAAHLFSKQLSRHQLSAYQELCDGAGTMFKAVAVGHTGNTPTPDESYMISQLSSKPSPSSASTILGNGLDAQNPGAEDCSVFLSLQTTLEATRQENNRLAIELAAYHCERRRLVEEGRLLADRYIAKEILLQKCLSAFDSIPILVAGVRAEVSEAIGEQGFSLDGRGAPTVRLQPRERAAALPD